MDGDGYLQIIKSMIEEFLRLAVILYRIEILFHILTFSRNYNYHINIKICAMVYIMKYIHKYIYKRNDFITIQIKNKEDDIK